ncbi:MAG TPA: hypothetical protein DCQ90_09735 [Erysipelotrichaceae bacterium]|nr:hypothetical protein [Erysipelotrichaceae bacterium]
MRVYAIFVTVFPWNHLGIRLARGYNEGMNYITLDKTSAVPIYKQLKTSIQSAILSGKLKPLDFLPKEEEVCSLCNINRQVVRKAYAELIDEGLVARKKGGSPFVYRAMHLIVPLTSLPLIDEIDDYTVKFERRILVIEKIKGSESESVHFFDEMFRISMVFMHMHVPVYRQEIYLDAQQPRELQIHHFYTTNFKDLLEKDADMTIDKINNFAYQSELTKLDAGLLLLPVGSPAMNVESHVIDLNGKRIAVIESVYPGDYFHFTHEESYGE